MVWDRPLSLRFNFKSGTLKQDLAELPEKMLEYAFEVLIEQAQLMKGYAQVYVPVDTGSLRDSIRVERGGKGKYWREVKVRAGGYVINPKTGRFVDYAGYVEARYHFMERAWHEVCPDIADLINRRILEMVKP